MSKNLEQLNPPQKESENPVEDIMGGQDASENSIVPLTPEQKAKIEASEKESSMQARKEIAESFGETGELEKELADIDSHDFYKVLGVLPGASADEIKSAYRAQVKIYHPDKNTDKELAEKNFKIISEAYEVLSDSEKKKRYDNTRDALAPTEENKTQEIQGFRNELMVKMEVGEEQLPAIIENNFKGDINIFTKFVYETDTCSGDLEELSGNLKKDSEAISKFFREYDMNLDEESIQKIGAGIYEGAFKQKRKKEKSLLNVFSKFLKKAYKAIEEELPSI